MTTKTLTRKQLAEQSFDCCMQIVKSYGPIVDECHRQGMVNCMQHFKDLYVKEIEKENKNG